MRRPSFLIPKSQYRQMPWKNLKGVTAQIDRVPDQEGYLWRLSSAKITSDGAFSSFPGFDRLLVVTEGAGIFLNEYQLRPLEPFRFQGEDELECRLTAGEVTDLGLIFDRQKIRGEMVCFFDGPGSFQREPLAWYVFDLRTGDTYKDIPLGECLVQQGVLISIFSIWTSTYWG